MKIFLLFFMFILSINIIVTNVLDSKKAPLKIKCQVDNDCTPYAVCKQIDNDELTRGTCNCMIGYEPNINGDSCKQIKCIENSDCETQHQNTICLENKKTNSFSVCGCANHFKATKNYEACVQRKNIASLNEECQYGSDCGDWTECVNKTCHCKIGSKKESDGINCIPVSCTTNTDCKGDFDDLVCNVAKHQCYQIPNKCNENKDCKIGDFNWVCDTSTNVCQKPKSSSQLSIVAVVFITIASVIGFFIVLITCCCCYCNCISFDRNNKWAVAFHVVTGQFDLDF